MHRCAGPEVGAGDDNGGTPALGPAAGLTPVIAGAAYQVNTSALTVAEVPIELTTVTS